LNLHFAIALFDGPRDNCIWQLRPRNADQPTALSQAIQQLEKLF